MKNPRTSNRNIAVEFAVGFAIAGAIGAIAVPIIRPTAEPDQPSVIQQCMKWQDGDNGGNPGLTGSCQVGSVRNP